MNNNPLLASFESQLALISPSFEGSFAPTLQAASDSLAKLNSANDAPMMADDFWFSDDDWRAIYRPYTVVNGTLIISVKGVLLHDFPYQMFTYATGYKYLAKALERGLADPEVKQIAWVINSPGGHVAGAFQFADVLYAARGQKPMWAICDESAYSAAYLIASAVGPIHVPMTGGVGSIGVICVHFDYSKAIEKEGLKVTFFTFGAHKADGNPYEPLSDDARKRMQARIDELGEIFVATVARNRSLDADAVRDTQALTYSASEAVSIGLADKISNSADAIAALAAQPSEEEEAEMPNENKAAVDMAAVDQARAEGFAAGKIEGHAEGMKEGATAERTRVSAIVNSEEGQKRPTLALKMATGEKYSALDADTVKEMLADLPEEKAAVAVDEGTKTKAAAAVDFNAAMDNSNNPDLGAPANDQEQMSRVELAFAAAGRKRKAV